MDKRTTKRRLLKLANLLLKNANNKKGLKFDLSDWGSVKNEEAPISCGTTACAMGLAALSGEFKRAGLRAEFWTFIMHGSAQRVHVCYRGYSGLDAAMHLFGITNQQANFFFRPESTPLSMQTGAKGERFLAARIKKFVKTGILPY